MRASTQRGFTLIELIIVIAIIGILASIALPNMRHAPKRAKEAVLKENLYQMRSCIDQHLADKGAYPGSIESLVEAGYLRFVPEDPILDRKEWGVVWADAEIDEDLQPYDDDFGSQTGIIDVYSLAEGPALDGSDYADW